MRTALFALLLCAAPAGAQDRPTADQLAEQVLALRAKRADLEKQEAAAVAALRAELKRLNELGAKLGLDIPPAPKPPEPTPADPLRQRLKAAFDADPTQLDLRKGQALDLAALYREAAKLAADPSVDSAGELLDRVRRAGMSLVGADALREVRKVAGVELGSLLPTDAPLTAEQRAAAAALFGRLAVALEEVGK